MKKNSQNDNPLTKFISDWFEQNAPGIKSEWLWMLNQEIETRLSEQAQLRWYFMYIFTRLCIAVVLTLMFYFITLTTDSDKKSDPSHYKWLNELHYKLSLLLSVEKWFLIFWCLFFCIYNMFDIWAWLFVLRHMLYHIFGPI